MKIVKRCFFPHPSDELVVVKNNACKVIHGIPPGKFKTCPINLNDDEFIRHGSLRPRKVDLTFRKACEQWISSIRS